MVPMILKTWEKRNTDIWKLKIQGLGGGLVHKVMTAQMGG